MLLVPVTIGFNFPKHCVVLTFPNKYVVLKHHTGFYPKVFVYSSSIRINNIQEELK